MQETSHRAAHSPPATTTLRPRPCVSAAGPPDADGRELIVDLAALRRGVLALPEPDPDGLRCVRAGAALLSALIHESSDFGPAAPGTGPDSPIADSILALTDAAFNAAYDIVRAAAGGEDGLQRPSTLDGVVAEALDPNLFSTLFAGLAALPAVPDPTIAPEFV